MSTLTRRQRRILRRAARRGRPIPTAAITIQPAINSFLRKLELAEAFIWPWSVTNRATSLAADETGRAIAAFTHAMATTPAPHRQILHNGRKPR